MWILNFIIWINLIIHVQWYKKPLKCFVSNEKMNQNFYIHCYILAIGRHSNSLWVFIWTKDFGWEGFLSGAKLNILKHLYLNDCAEYDNKIPYIMLYMIIFWPVKYLRLGSSLKESACLYNVTGVVYCVMINLYRSTISGVLLLEGLIAYPVDKPTITICISTKSLKRWSIFLTYL